VRETGAANGRIIDCMRERAQLAHGTTATKLDVLHADYATLCKRKGFSTH
jgi:hypothetical protein